MSSLINSNESLAGLSTEELMLQVDEFAKAADLQDHIEDFQKGALVAQNPEGISFFTSAYIWFRTTIAIK
jgi:hypothetical protein